MKPVRFLANILVALALFAASCTTSSNAPAEPDKRVLIVMRDDFTFDPAEVEVSPGEVVEFEVANKGAMVHEFLIGDEAQQQEFEKEMQEGGHEEHGGGVPGVSVDPGGEETFVFTFPEQVKDLLFGCHEPGHYAAGMRGAFKFVGGN